MLKIVIAAVPYSPNMGDGLIAEAIKRFGSGLLEGSEFFLLDIAGREVLESSSSFGFREAFIAVSGVMPATLRRFVVKFKLKRMLRQNDCAWHKVLSNADMVLVGGGQLLADRDLNFPLKLNQVALICDRVGTPFSFFSVGCSGAWSEEGRSLLDACFVSPNFRGITVRDDVSAAHFRKVFGERLGVKCSVTCDPVVVGDFNCAVGRKKKDPPLLAVCVSDPKNAAYSGSGSMFGKAGRVEDVFILACELSMRMGWRLRLFNNGAAEDRAFQLKIRKRLAARGIEAEIFEVRCPMDIVSAVGDSCAVFGMRMHALIEAYAQEVSILGVDWDDKLRGFASRIEAEHVIRHVDEISESVLMDFLELSQKRAWMNFGAKDRLKKVYVQSFAGLLEGALYDR